MKEPRILYLNNRYCSSVEELRGIFKSELSENTRNDILDLFFDDKLQDWLNNKNDKLQQEIHSIDKNLTNSEIINKLSSIFIGVQNSEKYYIENIYDYVDFINLYIENENNIKYSIKNNDSIKITDDNTISQLYIKIRNLKPLNENIVFNLVIEEDVDNKPIVIQQSISEINLLNENIIHFTDLKLFFKGGYHSYRLKLMYKNNCCFTCFFAKGFPPKITLKYSKFNIAFIYIQRFPEEKSFYMTETVLAGEDGKPLLFSRKKFAQILSSQDVFRCPTEEEWDYALKKGGIPSEDNIELYGWIKENSSHKIHKVKEKLPNELGLYDMIGNVWEIVEYSHIYATYHIRGGSYKEDFYQCLNPHLYNNLLDDYDSDSFGVRFAYSVSEMERLRENYPEYFI